MGGRLGDYRLTRMVSRGGSGEVYQAVDGAGTTYAVKVLLPSVCADEARLCRFYQEANAMMAVDHPNVIKCYEVSESADRHYLVTEWLEGANLTAWVCAKGLFSERRALKVVAEVADALAAVHSQGILHRDVAPNNIMMTLRGDIKLIDFEFSKQAMVDLGLTAEGVGLGRADYISPEQLQNARDVDHRTDVYALGATLYAIVTNRLPFPGTRYHQKWEAKSHDLYIPPTVHAPHVSDELQSFIGQLMVADRNARIQTAAEVAVAARELLHRLEEPPSVAAEADELKAQMWRVTAILPTGELGALEAFELEVADMIRRGELPPTAQAARGGVPPYRALQDIPEFKSAFRAANSPIVLNELAETGMSGCSSLLEQCGSALSSLGKSISVTRSRRR